jgi:hypothetical protein
MHMRHIHALVAIGVAMWAPGRAQAQGGDAAEPELWVGGHLGLSPLGTLKADAQGAMASADAATALDLGGRVDFSVLPMLSIGFAPTLRLNVKGTNDNDSGSQLDLPIRVLVGGSVAPMVRLYGFAAPGYSILFPPSGGGDDNHPSGFMIGFGGGVRYRLAPRFALAGELGYQFRFVSETVTALGQQVDVSEQVNYLTFTVAAVAAL